MIDSTTVPRIVTGTTLDVACRRRRRFAARISVNLGRHPLLHDAPAVEHDHAIDRSQLGNRRWAVITVVPITRSVR